MKAEHGNTTILGDALISQVGQGKSRLTWVVERTWETRPELNRGGVELVVCPL